MGTIASSVGLISGLNIQDIVTQLMNIEKKPLTLLQTRITTTKSQQSAYLALNAQLLAAKGGITRLAKASFFSSRAATSSDPAVLTATASEKAALDSYSFTVKSLVTTHQLVSAQGYASASSTIGNGTLTLEVGGGNVRPVTSLSSLNGYEGVRRGIIRITDRSGAVADVDLRTAVDVDEVLSAINSQSKVRVQARVSGDRIIVADATGLDSGALTISDVGGGFTASDLGIASSSTSGEITGSDIFRLSERTSLTRLNDGTGVRTAGVADDLRFTLRDGRQIDVNLSGTLRFGTRLAELNDGRGVELGTLKLTNRKGESREIDLSGAQTIQDVISAINGSGLGLSASLANAKISISDTSGGTASNLKIESVTGKVAEDLGIAADTASNGVSGSAVYRLDNVGAVLRAINYATANDGALTATLSADGKGITVTDHTIGAGEASIEALNGSRALQDLGLTGGFNASGVAASRRIVGGVNTVLLSSLNGGRGVDTSSLQITRTVGGIERTETIDVSHAQTLQEVLDAVSSYRDGNGNAVFKAQIAAGETGIEIRDIGGGTITGFSGATATDLRMAASSGTGTSGDLQLRYISENTLLSDLNQGRGITMGGFRITNSSGRSGLVTLSSGVHKTVGDVLRSINSLGLNVTAQVNANGDGIELVDGAGGSDLLTVTEDRNGTTAADLGIVGTAAAGTTAITGSFAKTVQITGSDTLESVVSKINAAKAGVKASIINDGTPGSGYRLIISSATTGTRGKLSYSTTGLDLPFKTLSQARDATLVIGSIDSPNSVVVTSSSNTVKNVVDGVDLNLLAPSTGPVSVTVAQDIEGMVTEVKTFVKTLNDALNRITDLTKYNAETNEKGILLGDSAPLQISQRIYSVLQSSVSGSGLRTLAEVGLTLGNGARLELDETRLRTALAEKPEQVLNLFTATQKTADGKTVNLGIAARLDAELNQITNATDGLITRQRNSLQERVDLFNTRATQMQKLLDQKQTRLYAQFQAMESALAKLQSQQSSISALASAASAWTSSK